MTLFRQFDGGVGEIAAALVLGDAYRGLVHETVKLTHRVSWIFCFDFGPDFVRLSPLIIQIFDDQLVLRIEVAIERHFAGACGLRYRFDPHPSDAPAVKEVLRTGENAVARSPGLANVYIRIRI